MIKRLATGAIVIILFYTYLVSQDNLHSNAMDIPVDLYIIFDISKTINKQKSLKTIDILNAILEKISIANDYEINCHRISISIMGGDFCEIRSLARFNRNETDNFKKYFSMFFSENQNSQREIDSYFQIKPRIDRDRTNFLYAFSELKKILMRRYAGNLNSIKNRNCAFVVISDGIQDPENEVQSSSKAPKDIKNKAELQKLIKELLEIKNDSNYNLFFFFFHLDETYESFWREECKLYLGAYYNSVELNFPGHQVEEMFQIAGKEKFFQIKYGKFEAQEVSKVYRLCMTAKTNINDDILYELKIDEKDNQPIKFLHSVPTFLRVGKSSEQSYAFENFILYFMLPTHIENGKYRPDFKLIPKFSNESGIHIINEPPLLEVIKEEQIYFHPYSSLIHLDTIGGTTKFCVIFESQGAIGGKIEIEISETGGEMPTLKSGTLYKIDSQGDTNVTFIVERGSKSGLITGTLKFRTSRYNRPIFCKNKDGLKKELLKLKFFAPDSWYDTFYWISFLCIISILGLIIYRIYKLKTKIIIKIGGKDYKKSNFPLALGNEDEGIGYIKTDLNDKGLGPYTIAQLRLSSDKEFLLISREIRSIDIIEVQNDDKNLTLETIGKWEPISPGGKIIINRKHEYRMEIMKYDQIMEGEGLFKQIRLPIFQSFLKKNKKGKASKAEISLIAFIILILFVIGSALISTNLLRTESCLNGWYGFISTILSILAVLISLCLLIIFLFGKKTHPSIYSKNKKKCTFSLLAFSLKFLYDIVKFILL